MVQVSRRAGEIGPQLALGMMYFGGQGITKDYTRAYMWWHIAATQGSEVAKRGRDIIGEQMTPAQIAEAQKQARECVAKEYKGC